MKNRRTAWLIIFFVSGLASSLYSGEHMEIIQRKYQYQDEVAKFPLEPIFVISVRTQGNDFKPFEHQNTFTIYFDKNLSSIGRDQEIKLVEFAKSHTGQMVNIAAYTCPLGSLRHNRILALKRAQSVAVWLQERGFEVGCVQAKPKCCYVSKAELWKNRRVEIRCNRQKCAGSRQAEEGG